MIYEWKVAGTCIIALNIYYLWPFGSFPGILDCWINVPGRYCTGTVGMEVASSARGFGRGKPTDPAGGPGAPTAAWPQGWLRARSAGPRRRDGHCCCAPRAYGVCCGQDGWRSLCRCCPPFYFWGSVVVSCWRWQFWGREITDRPTGRTQAQLHTRFPFFVWLRLFFLFFNGWRIRYAQITVVSKLIPKGVDNPLVVNALHLLDFVWLDSFLSWSRA